MALAYALRSLDPPFTPLSPSMDCDAADSLLLTLYTCPNEPTQWRLVLDRLRAEMGVHSVVVQGLRMSGERLRSFWTAHDSATDDLRYQARISDLGNPRLESRRMPRTLPTNGMISFDDQIFSAGDRPLRQRFTQQLSELGLGRYMGGLVALGTGEYLGIALHRSVDDDRAFSGGQQRRLSQLLPHLAQAVVLGQALASARGVEAVLRAYLDRWFGALFVCEIDGRVRWMNRRADQHLRSGVGLRIRDGLLQGPSAGAQRCLSGLLRGVPERSTPGYMALQHASHRSQLAVQTLSVSSEAGPLAAPGPLQLIMLTSDEAADEIPAPALAVLFELTDAESRLLGALVGGRTIQEYALARGVALGTVRTQLKQVLAKTGASRQSDLVRRVLCSAAAHAAGFHDGRSSIVYQ